MRYIKEHKTSFYYQGLTRKDNCFRGYARRLDGSNNRRNVIKIVLIFSQSDTEGLKNQYDGVLCDRSTIFAS
jgi:hypothetical protein